VQVCGKPRELSVCRTALSGADQSSPCPAHVSIVHCKIGTRVTDVCFRAFPHRHGLGPGLVVAVTPSMTPIANPRSGCRGEPREQPRTLTPRGPCSSGSESSSTAVASHHKQSQPCQTNNLRQVLPAFPRTFLAELGEPADQARSARPLCIRHVPAGCLAVKTRPG